MALLLLVAWPWLMFSHGILRSSGSRDDMATVGNPVSDGCDASPLPCHAQVKTSQHSWRYVLISSFQATSGLFRKEQTLSESDAAC